MWPIALVCTTNSSSSFAQLKKLKICWIETPKILPMGLIFIVDTNGYDYLVESEDIWRRTVLACQSEQVCFLMTQVQIDQIRAMFNTAKEFKARNMLAIPHEFVKTSAFLFGFSKIGLAEFGPPRRVDEIRGDAFKDDLDALLADTARRDSAVLVTADKRLSRKAKAVGVEVWHPTDLIDLIWSLELEESAKPESSPYMHN
jgi:hypothetical protein